MIRQSSVILSVIIAAFFLFPMTQSANASQDKYGQGIAHLEQRFEKRFEQLEKRLATRKAQIANRFNRRTGQVRPYCQRHNLNEMQCINAWIQRNNLNPYGDPRGTLYTGGTPLFDESTGATLSRYDYILSKHPNTPWRYMR